MSASSDFRRLLERLGVRHRPVDQADDWPQLLKETREWLKDRQARMAAVEERPLEQAGIQCEARK